MANSFTQKVLSANIMLNDGTFDGKNNTKVITGLRMEVGIEKGGHPTKNECKVRVYGMLRQDMDSLTTIPKQASKPLAVHHNRIQIFAGDAAGMSVAFAGDISEAWASYQSPPNLYFHMAAIEGFYPAIAPVVPKSYKGGVSVHNIMQALAMQMGLGFQDAGVTTQLRNPYFHGTAYDQARAVAAAANCEFGIDDGTLFIAPRGVPRPGLIPLISAATGLKEYPVFSKKGLEFSCLYNPGIVLGGKVQIQSDLSVANGVWKVNSLKHNLACLVPGGHWVTSVEASYVGS